MSTLLIEGGHRLQGRVAVEGNKNAALPLLAACLLTEDECVLTNVPRIGDVEVMARLLLDIGAEVDGIGSTTLRIRAPQLRKHAPDRGLVGRLRGSVLLLGPLLARLGRAHIAPPGGDFPARRSISTHLEALEAMGARQSQSADHMLEAPDGLKGASMYLFEASVTGTETALLAARRREGRRRYVTQRSSLTSSSSANSCRRWESASPASARRQSQSKACRVRTARSIGSAAITSRREAGLSWPP
jgi:UDP-N-acetylglucosamine 1-carboxyvinyltransferase